MSDLLVGTTLLAAFLAGTVALFAPCCVSVMLPAYLAAAARRRVALVAMTFAFAAGIATLILPVAMGASWIAGQVTDHHALVYGVGAVAMVALGVATLAGWQPHLPMPSRRPDPTPGPAAAYMLGLFSGIASACCAPVVAGVIAVAGASASFPVALAVGVTYVFGMVAPLFVMALLWDRHAARFEGRASRRVRLPFTQRTLPAANAAAGTLLIAMGALVAVLAVSGPQMNTEGWQGDLAANLDHIAHLITSSLASIPGLVVALVLAVALGTLAWIGLRQTHPSAPTGDAVEPPTSPPPRGDAIADDPLEAAERTVTR